LAARPEMEPIKYNSLFFSMMEVGSEFWRDFKS
jgi:hypothetical protein